MPAELPGTKMSHSSNGPTKALDVALVVGDLLQLGQLAHLRHQQGLVVELHDGVAR